MRREYYHFEVFDSFIEHVPHTQTHTHTVEYFIAVKLLQIINFSSR